MAFLQWTLLYFEKMNDVEHCPSHILEMLDRKKSQNLNKTVFFCCHFEEREYSSIISENTEYIVRAIADSMRLKEKPNLFIDLKRGSSPYNKIIEYFYLFQPIRNTGKMWVIAKYLCIFNISIRFFHIIIISLASIGLVECRMRLAETIKNIITGLSCCHW